MVFIIDSLITVKGTTYILRGILLDLFAMLVTISRNKPNALV